MGLSSGHCFTLATYALGSGLEGPGVTLLMAKTNSVTAFSLTRPTLAYMAAVREGRVNTNEIPTVVTRLPRRYNQ